MCNIENAANRRGFKSLLLIIFGESKKKGIIFNDWEEAKELRRFSLKALRDLGFGKRSSEMLVIEEVRCMTREIERLKEEGNGVVDLDKIFNKAALNVVWNLTASERFDYDDQRMVKLYNFIEKMILLGKDIIGKPLGVLVFLRFFPPFRSTFIEASKGLADMRKLIKETIDNHKATLDVENPRDFIDKFLVEDWSQSKAMS